MTVTVERAGKEWLAPLRRRRQSQQALSSGPPLWFRALVQELAEGTGPRGRVSVRGHWALDGARSANHLWLLSPGARGAAERGPADGSRAMPVGWNWAVAAPEMFLNGGSDSVPSRTEALVTKPDSQAPWDPLGPTGPETPGPGVLQRILQVNHSLEQRTAASTEVLSTCKLL